MFKFRIGPTGQLVCIAGASFCTTIAVAITFTPVI